MTAEGGKGEEGKERKAKSKPPSSLAPFLPLPLFASSPFVLRLRRALRGEVTPGAAVLEAGRRVGVKFMRGRERARLARARGAEGRARLAPEFARMSAGELLEHFRAREAPKFLAGVEECGASGRAQRGLFPRETARLIESAEEVLRGRWSLLGYGPFEFGERVDWLQDPVSGARWPLDYHADVRVVRGDGSDIRVVWELNRLGHVLTLARAYAVAGDERYAEAVVRQLLEWRAANPVGFGPNWACAMEAALRAMNVIAALRLVRHSPRLDAESFAPLLATLDEHGAHVRRNLEYSYIARGNHYLSDVAGLFWLGASLPELARARAWREFGWRELLNELDEQVLADGADCESSTGYHRFVAELFLYSFVLARGQGIEIEERHRRRLRAMLEYVRAYVRPDGRAPLVGDTDGGRALPLVERDADDHAYLVALGAAVFEEPRWKTTDELPEELLWLLGEEDAREYASLPVAAAGEEAANESRAFTDAGTYVMRAGDLYLLFNASGAGLKGRGSHAHNDALGIEVAACSAVFVQDPGTYVYTRDFEERHLFRSTAYHSTVEVDGAEQNATDPRAPFRIGDEARPRVLLWESDEARDFIVAEHGGYARLARGGVTHRRSVYFDKRERVWLVEDSLTGSGEHVFRFVFHLAPGTDASVLSETHVEVCDRITGACLVISPFPADARPALEPRWSSREYGAKTETLAACWTVRAPAPFVARWVLIPLRARGSGAAPEQLLRNVRMNHPGVSPFWRFDPAP